jgi:hypothetical protein
VAHHLSVIQGLLGPMISGVEDMERLKKEVEMWKGEWGRVEREKKRLEGVVQGMEDRQAVSHLIPLDDEWSLEADESRARSGKASQRCSSMAMA